MFKNVKNLTWNEDNIQGGNLTMGNCKIKLPSALKKTWRGFMLYNSESSGYKYKYLCKNK